MIIVDLLKLILIVSVFFIVGTMTRSKLIDKEEYYSYQLKDGLFALLGLYICLFMTNIEFGGLTRNLLFLEYPSTGQIMWLPFSYLAAYKDYNIFLNDVYAWQTNPLQIEPLESFLYYLRVFLYVLPLAFISYRTFEHRKVYGFMMALLLSVSIFFTLQLPNIGDALLLVSVAFGCLIYLQKFFVKKGLSKLKLPDYLVFITLAVVTSLFVVTFSFFSYGQDKIIGEIPLDKKLVLGDGLAKMHLDSVQWSKNSNGIHTISFYGHVTFNEEQFDLNQPINPQDIHITYNYAFNGMDLTSGTNNHDFDRDLFGFGLDLRDYSNWQKHVAKDTLKPVAREKAAYFEFYGASEMAVSLDGHEDDYNFQVLDEGFGNDEPYPYYKITYTSDKYKGKDLGWIVRPIPYALNGAPLPSSRYVTVNAIEKETEDNITQTIKCYFFQTDIQEIKTVDYEVYGGRITYETNAEELLLSLNSELFKNCVVPGTIK